MAQSQGPRSYRMASDEMRGILHDVHRAAKALLLEHLGFSEDGAERLARELPREAFKIALDQAMKDSSTMPVQPDYLVAQTAAWTWLLACQCCGYVIAEHYPEPPVNIPDTCMYDGSVPPSPEHEALIREENDRKSRQEVAKIKGEETAQAAGRRVTLGPTSMVLRHSPAVRGGPSGQGGPPGRGTPEPVPIEDRQDGEPSIVRSDDDDRIALVTSYFFKVENPATEFMQELWDRYEFEGRYPKSEGYTCTGRPFEVKLHHEQARTFFCPKPCDRERILDVMRYFGPIRMYVHSQGDFDHIGFSTEKDGKWTSKDNRLNFYGFLYGLTRAFDRLANWAAGIKNQEIGIRYTNYMEDSIFSDLKKLELPVGATKCVTLSHNGKGEQVASAVNDELESEDKVHQADGPVGEVRAPEKIEKSKGAETRKGKEKSDPKKGSGKGSSPSAADVAMDAELERCKKAMQSILKEKSGTVRLEKATVWLLRNTPKMKHLNIADVVACMLQWWKDNLGLANNQLEMGQADEFERLTMGFISRRTNDEGLANPDDKTDRSEDPALGSSKKDDAEVVDPHTGILADDNLCDTALLESGDEFW